MGSGASKKKPDSTVQKKLSAVAAFSEAGSRAKDKQIPESNQLTKVPENSTETNGTHHGNQNGGVVGQESGKAEHIPNGDTKPNEEGSENDEVLDKVTKIQSVFRGFQDRKSMQKQNEMATKIQRRFRRHRSSVKSESDISESGSITESATLSQAVLPPIPDYEKKPVKKLTKEEQMQLLAERKEHRRQRARAWRDSGTDGEKKSKEYKVEIGEKTKQEFGSFQSEIIELQWFAEQQLEVTACGGKDFVPPRVLLVSSKVPKAHLLEGSAHTDGVLVFNYDFENDTFDSLLDAIRVNLQAYRPGCKAQSLCLYAQGGPGYLYVLKKKVLTTAKLKKESEADQVRFWQELGKMMSRIHPEDTVIHIMGCNILGKESGLDLFDHLENIMQPNIVRFESPMELTTEDIKDPLANYQQVASAQMVTTYFDPVKYKMWKSTKYSRSQLKLPPSMK